MERKASPTDSTQSLSDSDSHATSAVASSTAEDKVITASARIRDAGWPGRSLSTERTTSPSLAASFALGPHSRVSLDLRLALVACPLAFACNSLKVPRWTNDYSRFHINSTANRAS